MASPLPAEFQLLVDPGSCPVRVFAVCQVHATGGSGCGSRAGPGVQYSARASNRRPGNPPIRVGIVEQKCNSSEAAGFHMGRQTSKTSTWPDSLLHGTRALKLRPGLRKQCRPALRSRQSGRVTLPERKSAHSLQELLQNFSSSLRTNRMFHLVHPPPLHQQGGSLHPGCHRAGIPDEGGSVPSPEMTRWRHPSARGTGRAPRPPSEARIRIVSV
jgi:hypothetical protein